MVKMSGDKGINLDNSAFIPFSTSATGRGDKGINPYKVYPYPTRALRGASE